VCSGIKTNNFEDQRGKQNSILPQESNAFYHEKEKEEKKLFHQNISFISKLLKTIICLSAKLP